jgi:methylated-DNA-[protein]-cysteine S-methyltransferase
MGDSTIMRHSAKPTRTARRTQTRARVESYAAVLETPWSGVMLGVSMSGEQVTAIDFLPGNGNTSAYDASGRAAREAVAQLRTYFRDAYHRFTISLAPTGTPFQRRVWDALRRIPAGTTRSYGELAQQLDSSARAVGGACRANPIPLMIPCHRVVGTHDMGGFMGVTSGPGILLKQRLLSHESVS